MTEIAEKVGLKAQFQVTRLLKLKTLRAEVRQELLKILKESILDKAKFYADPTNIADLMEEIELALNEQTLSVIQEAESNASAPKNRPMNSLFALRLCRYLERYMEIERVQPSVL